MQRRAPHAERFERNPVEQFAATDPVDQFGDVDRLADGAIAGRFPESRQQLPLRGERLDDGNSGRSRTPRLVTRLSCARARLRRVLVLDLDAFEMDQLPVAGRQRIKLRPQSVTDCWSGRPASIGLPFNRRR